jgi:hypothetical protein
VGTSGTVDGGEGNLNLCSFWYVEALTRAGRVKEARTIFETMLACANHVGLYAEQIGASGGALGNLPAGIHAPGTDQRSGERGSRPRPSLARTGPSRARRRPPPPARSARMSAADPRLGS